MMTMAGGTNEEATACELKGVIHSSNHYIIAVAFNHFRKTKMTSIAVFTCVTWSAQAFIFPVPTLSVSRPDVSDFWNHGGPCVSYISVSKYQKRKMRSGFFRQFAFYDEQSPSDYDTAQVALSSEKRLVVDKREEDALIRDALKRELLLLSSVTNRGEYASGDEQNMLVDLVAQLEALNPTPDPASMNSQGGEWDLCLASTQFFRSSPFFQSLRSAAGESNRSMMQTAFDIHDRATTSGRVGRVRQTITSDKLISSVDLEVGLMPGFPVKVKGTVVTTAALRATGPDNFELQIQKTAVTGSNIPLFNQWLDNVKLEIPMNDIFTSLAGSVPAVINSIFYLDEGMRITRDEDDNFFVYTRS
jgi:PAP_fibrillin